MKKTAVIIGVGALAAGAIYLLTRPKKLVLPSNLSPDEQKQLLVASASAAPTPEPSRVIQEVAESMGVSTRELTQAIRSQPASFAQIEASATTAAMAAGIPNEQVQVIASAAQEVAQEAVQSGATPLEATIAASNVIATAIGVEPELAASALVAEMAIPQEQIVEPAPVSEPVTHQQLWQTTTYSEPVAPVRTRLAIQGLGSIWKSVLENQKLPTMNHYGLRGNMGNVFDWISDKVADVTNTYNQYAPVLDPIRDQAIRNALPGGTVPQGSTSMQPYAQQQSAAQPSAGSGMSTGAKVAIGVGALAVIGGIIWAATRH